MSISYEEALATLEAMFGAPWTRESLDLVLRHEKGPMENTCDRILNYGSERNPQGLLEQLQSGQGGASASGGDQQVNMDEEIARQLAAQQGGSGATSGGAASSSTAPTASTQQHKGRGTPTVLPKDFLRIPGYPHRSVLAERAGSGSASRSGGSGPGMNGGGAQMDDEALARMLQDEFFSQELARNPEFAHLAGGRVPHRTGRSGATVPPGQRRSTANTRQQQQQPQGPNIIDKLSGTLSFVLPYWLIYAYVSWKLGSFLIYLA